MSSPTLSQVHTDSALTNVSVAYLQSADNFIADRVFPVVPVEKKSDVYYTYTKNDWFRDEAKKRAPGTESAGNGFGLSTATYTCDVYAFHKDVYDQIRSNADPAIDVDADAARFVTQRLLIAKERGWASTFFTTSVWGTDVVGGSDFTLWSTLATSDPIGDISTGRLNIAENTGFMPNTLVVGMEVHEILKRHPDIVDRFKYTSAESISESMIARILEVDRYIVSKATYATNAEGATGAYDFVAGKNALLCYVPPTPSLMTPAAGYTFAWRGQGGNDAGMAISRFRMEQYKSDRIEGEMAYDQKVIGTDLGYFFSAAVA